MDADFFVNILKWHLIDTAEVYHLKKWFLVQDNDPKHTSKKAKAWMAENMKKNQFQWPSQSPDLNPIENIFGWIKHQFDRKHPKTIKDLKIRIEEIWDHISPEFLVPYWQSMPRRCQMVIKNKGYKIKY